MLRYPPTTKPTIAALALVGILALSISAHLGSSPIPNPTDDYPTPDCFCQIGWEAQDFDPPEGQTAPGDWDEEWADME